MTNGRGVHADTPYVPDLFDMASADGEKEAGNQDLTAMPDGSQQLVVEPETQPENDSAAVVDESTNVDEPGFTRYWRQYVALVDRLEKELDALIKSSKGAMGLSYTVGCDFRAYAAKDETRKNLVEAIYDRAEREFAPPMGRLTIERGRSPRDVDDDEFDPDALWKELEAEYAGDAGVERGLVQAACRLVSLLSLAYKPPARKANRLEVSQQIWSEKNFQGKAEMGYSTVQSLGETYTVMAAFCTWAGDVSTAHQLIAKAGRLWDEKLIVSRQRYEMGSIAVVMFHKNVQWELHGELADKFHEFIARYGASALRERS